MPKKRDKKGRFVPNNEIPTFPGEIRGFRSFNLVNEQIASLNNKFWVPGTNKAKCLLNGAYGHNAPAHNCHCGFNMFYSLDHLQGSAYRRNIIGLVVGWGKLHYHGDGFRSSHAEIKLLSHTQPIEEIGPRLVEEIHKTAKFYGIKVVPFDQLKEEAKAFGNEVSEDMLKSLGIVPIKPHAFPPYTLPPPLPAPTPSPPPRIPIPPSYPEPWGTNPAPWIQPQPPSYPKKLRKTWGYPPWYSYGINQVTTFSNEKEAVEAMEYLKSLGYPTESIED